MERVKFSAGFTLLEILLSIAIVVLIGTMTLTSFVNSRRIRDLSASASNILSVARLAQSKALGGEDNSPWGLRLEQYRYIIFRGASFVGSTFTQIYNLPASLEIININLNGSGQEIVFKRLTGRTDQYGSFVIRVKESVTNIVSVTIDSSGKVYQTGTAPIPTGTRIIDARHRAFNLGWSIKNSVTMTLTFSDPPSVDTVQNIATVLYFDAGKTKYDWSGAISVGGQDQTLRIHTTSLTDSNTNLSVDRDCRKNIKKLKISFDTKDIGTYEADCRTITVGPYGGVISEP